MQRTLFLIACFFICAGGYAQQYPFVQYTPKDGLINSRVRKAYQDSKGRMYFLTYNGLSVYDGARFRNYSTQNGLANDLINDIIEVGDDSLLVATNTGYLNTLVKGKVALYKTKDGFCPLVNQFFRISDDRIFISSDEGLFVLQNQKITQLNTYSPLLNDSVAYIGTITGAGNYLLLTTNEIKRNKGLYLYDIKKNSIVDDLTELRVQFLGKDPSNQFWISSPDQTSLLDSSALAAGKLSLVQPSGSFEAARQFQTYSMAFDKTSAWMVSQNKELIELNQSGSVRQIPLPTQISFSGIQHIFIDRENTIWLCNDGAGVSKMANAALQIFNSPFGTTSSEYATRAWYGDGVTWFSTTTNKIYRKSVGRLNAYTSNITPSPMVFHETARTIFSFDSKNVYTAEFDTTGNSISFQPLIQLLNIESFGKTMLVDPNGYILTCMNAGLGVWKNGEMAFLIPASPSDVIEGLSIDRNELLWVIKRYTDVEVYSLHGEDLSNYLHLEFKLDYRKIGGSPRSFVIDKKGLAWIGTRDKGLFAYQLKGKALTRVEHFHAGKGLTDNFITALACDSLNNIIAGTQTGIDRIVPVTDSTYRIENLSKTSNYFVFIREVWADKFKQAFALTNTGGFLSLSATDQKPWPRPQLLLEEVRVNTKSFNGNANELSYTENNLNFYIAAPSFIDEKQVTYSYLLEGSGNSLWSDTSSSNADIHLTNLPPGKYNLKVKAIFTSTPYQTAEISYAFKINPPWWQTWWFRLILALSVAGLVVLAARVYYRRKLEKQRIILERQQAIEKERTRIATDMHDDLGAGLSRIKFLSETIGIKKQQQIPIEEDISKIREYSHEMIDKMGEIVWALNEKNDSLSDLLSYTRSYAASYLAQNGIECSVQSPEYLSSAFVSGEFRRNVFLAVKEILHNVVKHSQASHVNMEMKLKHHLEIQVRDDGIGFDQSGIRPFSNGLHNIGKRMKDIGGRVEIRSEKGTEIKLMIPLSS